MKSKSAVLVNDSVANQGYQVMLLTLQKVLTYFQLLLLASAYISHTLLYYYKLLYNYKIHYNTVYHLSKYKFQSLAKYILYIIQ